MAVINIVGTKCYPGMEERFNEWYNEKHVPDLMKFKGLKRVTRYRMIGAAIGPRENPLVATGARDGYPKFLTIYEFEDPQTFERFENSPEAAAAREDAFAIKEEMGLELFWRVQYESIEDWEQGGGG